jgi:hypothetical protein
MIIIVKVVVGDPKRIKEAAQSLIGFLGVLFIKCDVVPKLAIITTDIECDLVSELAITEDLIRNIVDFNAMIALGNGGKAISGVLIRVVNEFVHVVYSFLYLNLYFEFWVYN